MRRTLDPPPEEPPQHHGISDQTHRVPEHHLRAEPPPEKAHVARVPEVPVHAPSDEDVSVPLLALDEVVEVGARVHHGRRPRRLAGDQHGGAEQQPGRVQGGRKQAAGVAREVVVVHEAFGKGRRVRDVVGPAVARQQEGGDGRGGRVREGGRVEFEEVEEGEEEEEEVGVAG